MIRKEIAGGIILVFAAIVSFAQQTFTATSSSKKIGIQDQVRVTYTIEGSGSLEGFEQPDFSGFQVLGTQQSFDMGRSFSVSFVLHPVKKGTISIAPARAKISGKIISSNTIAIEIVDGSLAPQRPQRSRQAGDEDDMASAMFRRMQQMMDESDRDMQDMMRRQQQLMEEYARRRGQSMQEMSDEEIARNIFIRLEVDKKSAYVGEQINATYKLCSRLGFESAMISKLPVLNGFWAQDSEVPRQQQQGHIEYINGVPFQVFLVKKTALFPTQSGTLELDPAKIDANTRQGTLHLSSPLVKINVKPLPLDNQPEHFTGAVGKFTAKADVSHRECTTDDMETFTFSINGSGNIKLIDNPGIGFPKELGVFDPQVTDTITGREPVTGKKVYTYNFNPQMPGTFTIPSVSFSYFDAAAGSYKTLNTSPIEVTVKEGKSYQESMAQNKKLPRDIHNIMTGQAREQQKAPASWVAKGWYWSTYSMPLLAFIGLIAYRRRKEYEADNTLLFKNKKANKVAWKRLATARKLLNEKDHTAFYEEISKAIWLYLSDKLSIPISHLSKENIAYELGMKRIAETQIATVQNLITECEMALYSPAGGQQQKIQTLEGAAAVIAALDPILSQSQNKGNA